MSSFWFSYFRKIQELNKSEQKHFLILFRGAGLQFRAIYSYCPESDEVTKLHGNGPKNVKNDMIEKFFK
jgi:calmodulin-regulated spectrin-associated protein